MEAQVASAAMAATLCPVHKFIITSVGVVAMHKSYGFANAPVPMQARKLDLTEVEGTADLLAAETEAQRAQVSTIRRYCQRNIEPWSH